MKDTSSNQELKKLVGVAAAQMVEQDMLCGIGTGSTVAFFIDELGRRVREENLSIVGVPTSFQSKLLCQKAGIPCRALQDCGVLDFAVDGADEIDPALNLIKGGGAAQTREKIVAEMARKFVVIADETKLVERLGCAFPVPVEIIPEALTLVSEKICSLGGEPKLRMGVRKDGPVITDNGQFILDVTFKDEISLPEFDLILHQTPGVIETGLFFGMTAMALIGKTDSLRVETLTRA